MSEEKRLRCLELAVGSLEDANLSTRKPSFVLETAIAYYWFVATGQNQVSDPVKEEEET